MIPVNEPVFNGNEKKYLNQCVETGWISSEGPFVGMFEKNMASYVGRKFGTACSSGTAALDIAVGVLELKSGDEVIMPTFTIISCAQALINKGVIPVLVDCDPLDFNMIVNDIESKITPRTKAIMIVHIYGITVDVDRVLEIADKYDLKVIEDAAEVHGQFYKDRPCGSFGDVSIFSFYPNKHITTGEGGMVLCNSKHLDDRAKSLRNLCFSNTRYIHEELGYNYRMTNMQAALGVAQLERIDDAIEKKRLIGNTYNRLLADLPFINLPVISNSYCENIYWVYAITVDDLSPISAKNIMQRFADKGIGTRSFFYPMHLQPVFLKMGLFNGESYPNSEKLYNSGLYIPSGLGITINQMEAVSDVLHGMF